MKQKYKYIGIALLMAGFLIDSASPSHTTTTSMPIFYQDNQASMVNSNSAGGAGVKKAHY